MEKLEKSIRRKRKYCIDEMEKKRRALVESGFTEIEALFELLVEIKLVLELHLDECFV